MRMPVYNNNNNKQFPSHLYIPRFWYSKPLSSSTLVIYRRIAGSSFIKRPSLSFPNDFPVAKTTLHILSHSSTAKHTGIQPTPPRNHTITSQHSEYIVYLAWHAPLFVFAPIVIQFSFVLCTERLWFFASLWVCHSRLCECAWLSRIGSDRIVVHFATLNIIEKNKIRWSLQYSIVFRLCFWQKLPFNSVKEAYTFEATLEK